MSKVFVLIIVLVLRVPLFLLGSPGCVPDSLIKVVGIDYCPMQFSDRTVNYYQNLALEQAKIKALDTFDISVMFTSTLKEYESKIEKGSVFNNLSSVFVNGVWVKTTSAPQYCKSKKDGFPIMNCRVEGLARPIEWVPAKFKYATLNSHFEDTVVFSHGEDFFIQFRTSESGYLTIFLDDAEYAQCLLPYYDDKATMVEVKADVKYTFFKPDMDLLGNKEIVNEYSLFADRDIDACRIYFIFSPKQLTKDFFFQDKEDAAKRGLPAGYLVPKQTKSVDFANWLQNARLRNSELQIKIVDLIIKKTLNR